ncbi:protein of unknown function [Xenorhabdus poinarii G6]|uniref:Uncharacterized protein n=1 Tax=Xenorhabdus poinarii G6 TaxID=1354304 RepID=A0A068R6U5_9GAMM|nr:protein of unknown function [Xenorhabdus poinarii G6]
MRQASWKKMINDKRYEYIIFIGAGAKSAMKEWLSFVLFRGI